MTPCKKFRLTRKLMICTNLPLVFFKKWIFSDYKDKRYEKELQTSKQKIMLFICVSFFFTSGDNLVNPLYTPWKHQKTRGFLMFSRDIEREKWHEISLFHSLDSFQYFNELNVHRLLGSMSCTYWYFFN